MANSIEGLLVQASKDDLTKSLTLVEASNLLDKYRPVKAAIFTGLMVAHATGLASTGLHMNVACNRPRTEQSRLQQTAEYKHKTALERAIGC